MINLLKHKPFLELLASCQPDQQQALLETASPEQVHCLCLCAENLRRKKYIIWKKKLQPYQHNINSLADRGKSGWRKKRILVQHGKGFLGIMLRPILEGLAELA